jgi:hypothetical protein
MHPQLCTPEFQDEADLRPGKNMKGKYTQMKNTKYQTI